MNLRTLLLSDPRSDCFLAGAIVTQHPPFNHDRREKDRYVSLVSNWKRFNVRGKLGRKLDTRMLWSFAGCAMECCNLLNVTCTYSNKSALIKT